MNEFDPEVLRLHDEGWSVAEIAEELCMSRFAVRAQLNRVEPPDHGRAFLLPNTSGLESCLDGTILDLRIDPADDRRPADIVASLRKRGEAGRRELQPCGTPAAYSRHRYRQQKACPACLAAVRDLKRRQKDSA